ncbi:MAG: hypothetical protein M1817_001934 [Caeruleum heppii]|nr:MAG: hypothetical protein M1817_001934 [Caeruleum heppii]
MPHSNPSAGNHVQHERDTTRALSDQDVQVLWSIVKEAQRAETEATQGLDAGAIFNAIIVAPERVFERLFQAYETVLPDYGYDPDDETFYFNLLLKFGQNNARGTNYIEKFKSLMGQMGITLEFDADDGDSQLIVNATASHAVGLQGTAPIESHSQAAGTTLAWVQERNQISAGPPPQPAFQPDEWSLSHSDGESVDRRHSVGSVGVGGRLNGRSIASTPPSYPRQIAPDTRRSRSVSSQRSHPNDRRASSWASHGSYRARQPTSQRDDRRRARERLLESGRRPHPDQDYSPPRISMPRSQSELEDLAQAFEHVRAKKLARFGLEQWHRAASESFRRHRYWDRSVTEHVERNSKQRAFKCWRKALREKREERQLAETQNFYARLGRRAHKARDLYLKTKALTHWAQCAHDEVQRTAIARRHILRTRYFNAWLDITAVNALKVRQHTLRTFLSRLKRSSDQMVQDHHEAVARYERGLVQRCYTSLILRFRERWITAARAIHLKSEAVSRLKEAYTAQQEQEGWIECRHRRALLRKCWDRLKAQTIEIEGRKDWANRFGQIAVVKKALVGWRKRTRSAPLSRQVSLMVDSRVVRESFTAWSSKMRAEFLAAEVNRLRLLRKAWTAWNDQLRCQALAAKIDERVMLRALYRWVLKERGLLLGRLMERRLKEFAMGKLFQGRQTRQMQNAHATRIAIQHHDRSLLRSVMSRWRLQVQLQEKRQHLAHEFLAPRLTQDTLQAWTTKSHHLQRLEDDARRADFYFLTTRSIKAWRSAVTRSKREKRRVAYAQVRRRVKMDCARTVLIQWRQRTRHVLEMRKQAETASQNRLVVVAVGHYDGWRARTEEMVDMTNQATSAYHESLLRRSLKASYARLQRQREMEVRAIYRDEMRVLDVAAGILRKLSMRAFQHNSRERNAEEMRLRMDKKHCRNIIRHWRDKTTIRQEAVVPSTNPKPRQRRLDPERTEIGESALGRAEEWTAFGDGFDVADWMPSMEATSSMTPLPGYLSTPSKRAARAKALVRLSATPRTPQVMGFQLRSRPEQQDRTRW